MIGAYRRMENQKDTVTATDRRNDGELIFKFQYHLEVINMDLRLYSIIRLYYITVCFGIILIEKK